MHTWASIGCNCYCSAAASAVVALVCLHCFLSHLFSTMCSLGRIRQSEVKMKRQKTRAQLRWKQKKKNTDSGASHCCCCCSQLAPLGVDCAARSDAQTKGYSQSASLPWIVYTLRRSGRRCQPVSQPEKKRLCRQRAAVVVVEVNSTGQADNFGGASTSADQQQTTPSDALSASLSDLTPVESTSLTPQ